MTKKLYVHQHRVHRRVGKKALLAVKQEGLGQMISFYNKIKPYHCIITIPSLFLSRLFKIVLEFFNPFVQIILAWCNLINKLETIL